MKKITPRKNISLFKKGIEKINKSMKMKGLDVILAYAI